MENNFNDNTEISDLQHTPEALPAEKDASCAEAANAEQNTVLTAEPAAAAEEEKKMEEIDACETPGAAVETDRECAEPAKEETHDETQVIGKEQAAPQTSAGEPEPVGGADDPEEPQFPALELPGPVSDFRSGISAFGFSQQGKSHENKDMPCQDRSSLRFLSDTVIAAAVADGVGSCALSDYGSDAAVTAALDYLEAHLGEDLKDPGFVLDVQYMGKVLRGMMQHAFDRVKERADEMEQLLYSLQSTLTVAVYDGKTLYFGHAGDDGIVALTKQGKYEMVTTRHKGDEASSVYPLQSCNTWQYGMVNDVVGFVLATDGVLDAFVANQTEGNRIYYPFVEPAFNAVCTNAEETAGVCNDWYAYMQTPGYRAKVTDDLSFVCVVNQEAMKEATKPVFDAEEWNRKTQEYAAQRKAALYPPKQPEKKDPAVQEGTQPVRNAPKTPEPAADILKEREAEPYRMTAQGNATPGQNARQPQYQNPQTPPQQPNYQRPQTPPQQPHYQRPQTPPQQPNYQRPQTPPQQPHYQRPQTSPQQPFYQQPQGGSNANNANMEKLAQYGRKVVAGVTGFLVVGGEIMVDKTNEAVQRLKERVDEELGNHGGNGGV